jgi:hypothetical protein
MTANRWLLFLAALVGLGWPMAMSALAQSRQPSRPGGGVRGSVFVRAAAPGDDSRSNERITLPDFELVLKNVETGALAVTQKTDLFGRYNFPPQAPGSYRLVWQRQHGWDEGEHPNPVVVTSHTQYPIPVEIKP